MLTRSHLLPALLHALLRAAVHPQVYLPAYAMVVALAGTWLRGRWLRWKQAAREQKVRNWPTLTATIEVPTVIGGSISGKGLFFGTLTYFYRNPELQMGEYRRVFTSKARAKAWVKQFKNRTVLVHVNPCDPADSVLPAREVAGLDPPELPESRTKAETETLVAGEAIHALTPGMRLLCGASELVSLAGFAISAVLFAASLMGSAHLPVRLYYWGCGAMLAVSLLCTVALYIDLARSESGRQLLRTYRRWCPAWMRWSLTVTGVFFPALHPLLGLFTAIWGPYMHLLAKRFAPHLPYLLGCWVFFVATAFAAAILGSQEDPRLSIETARV
jgi:hypothetical protein